MSGFPSGVSKIKSKWFVWSAPPIGLENRVLLKALLVHLLLMPLEMFKKRYIRMLGNQDALVVNNFTASLSAFNHKFR